MVACLDRPWRANDFAITRQTPDLLEPLRLAKPLFHTRSSSLSIGIERPLQPVCIEEERIVTRDNIVRPHSKGAGLFLGKVSPYGTTSQRSAAVKKVLFLLASVDQTA